MSFIFQALNSRGVEQPQLFACFFDSQSSSLLEVKYNFEKTIKFHQKTEKPSENRILFNGKSLIITQSNRKIHPFRMDSFVD